MIHLNKGCRKCVFCGEEFSRESVCWLIDKRADSGLWAAEKAQPANASASSAPFRDAMDSFLRPDYAGQNFFQTVSGRIEDARQPEQIRLVVPEEDLDPAGGRNRYVSPAGMEVHIFRLERRQGGLPCLRFTQEFITAMEESGVVHLRHQRNQSYIEETCIRPVCPHCTSYLPSELLTESPDVFLARLALVGPIDAGKTTMNFINLVKKQFNGGAWSQNTEGMTGRTHYLASNYYEEFLKGKKLPTRSPKNIYIPPLLVRLTRKNVQVLIVLMDVAGELLEQIQQEMEKGDAPELRVFAAREILRQMDGYLLVLDSEKEFLPKGNALMGRADDSSEVKLADLVPICRGFVDDIKKPAALVLTKCEQLFTADVASPLPSGVYQTLFPSSSRLEELLWQQPEPNAGDSGYSSRHHEAVQFFLKPVIRKQFPILWAQATNIFSRVDVFPESNWGRAVISEGELKTGAVDIDLLDPFYSAAPVFWLLDVIDRGERQKT